MEWWKATSDGSHRLKVVETAQGNVETFELEIALDQTYIQNQNKRLR